MFKALKFSIRQLPKNQEPWEPIPTPRLPVGIQALEATAEFWLVRGFLKSLNFTLNLQKPQWLLALEKHDGGAQPVWHSFPQPADPRNLPEIQAGFAVFHLAGSKSSHLGKETFSSLLFSFLYSKKKADLNTIKRS